MKSSFLSTIPVLLLLLVLPFSKASDLSTYLKIGEMVQVNEEGSSLFEFNYPGIDTAYITDMATQVQVTMYDINCRVNDVSDTNDDDDVDDDDDDDDDNNDDDDDDNKGGMPELQDTNYGQMGIITSTTVKTAETKAFDMISLKYDNTDCDTTDGTGNLQFTFKTVPSEMAKLSALTTAPVDDISEIKFCVCFGLYAGFGGEINYLETKVTIFVTMNGDFDVSAVNVQKNNDNDDDYDYDDDYEEEEEEEEEIHYVNNNNNNGDTIF